MKNNNLYIACIDLSQRRCLVVGAGSVGLEKTLGLLAADASVVVVAPEAVAEIHALAAAGTIEFRERHYLSTDLDDCFLVVAATSDTRVNTAVHADAERRSMLVNVADVANLCNFILPAIVREGPLAIAISTAGASPALAQRMKREAAQSFDEAYAELAVLLEDLRPWAKATLPTYRDRKRFFDSIVNGTPDPINLLRRGRLADVHALIEDRKAAATETVRSLT